MEAGSAGRMVQLMSHAFEILGLEVRLQLAEEPLRAAFREAGKSAHPDAGGGDEDFARLQQAFETLASPSRRLKHWLELRGTPAETRGTVDASLMDLFGWVGEVTQRAEGVIRRRSESKSALGLAMLERETQACIESVEGAMRMVESAIERETARFPEIDAGSIPDLQCLSELARNLAFLEKWRTALRGIVPRLV